VPAAVEDLEGGVIADPLPVGEGGGDRDHPVVAPPDD
jgi:hypothetical protein